MGDYSYNKFQLNMMLGVGILGIILFFVSLSSGRTGSSFVMCFPLIMYFMLMNFKPIKIYDTHIEFKVAPVRGLNTIRFSEISRIERKNEKVLMIFKNDGKKVKLPLNLINEDDRSIVEDFISKKLNS
ncbi:MAG: hypothetical protein GY714_33055 [Desulfobacterales bacterium]|nr:hypothetical protein [Desulfobacterales bacterium]